jgi:hypothetical protein
VIKTSIQAALISVLAAAAFFGLLFAAATWLPQNQQAIRQHLIDVIASGEINARTSLGPMATLPVHRYAFDCLIFGIVLVPTGGAISNRMLAMDPAAQDPRVPPFPDCQALLRALPELGGGAVPATIQYDRYILGARVLGRVLLSAVSVETMRRVLLGSSYGLLGLIGLLAAWRFMHTRGDPDEARRAAVYGAIVACLALFYGAHHFDGLLNFAPMDEVHFVFILISLIWPLGEMRPERRALFAASYGSLIAIFEFMTGGIPLALALLPVLLALGYRGDTPSYLRTLVTLWGCFCIAVIASFAIKQAYAVAVSGDTDNFIAALLLRTYGGLEANSDANYSLPYLAMAYYRGSYLIGWGSSRLGAALVIGSLAVIALSTWKVRSASYQLRLACWSSLLALAAWIVVFLNHSILHAFFMARLLVIPLIAAAVLSVTELVSWRATPPATGRRRY